MLRAASICVHAAPTLLAGLCRCVRRSMLCRAGRGEDGGSAREGRGVLHAQALRRCARSVAGRCGSVCPLAPARPPVTAAVLVRCPTPAVLVDCLAESCAVQRLSRLVALMLVRQRAAAGAAGCVRAELGAAVLSLPPALLAMVGEALARQWPADARRAELRAHTVAQLRALCQCAQHGLREAGVKAELVARLCADALKA